MFKKNKRSSNSFTSHTNSNNSNSDISQKSKIQSSKPYDFSSGKNDASRTSMGSTDPITDPIISTESNKHNSFR